MMRRFVTCFGLVVLVFATSAILFGQTPRKVHTRPAEQRPTTAEPEPTPPEQAEETVKIDTNLVTIPVIASDGNGLFVSDLKQDEFTVYEDDVKQEVAFFATVNAPFHVILMLDTSASTEGKLRQIQNAALAFLEQLKPADRVKVISFDNELRDLNEFTNNREELRTAIMKTRPGTGTRLYDAFDLALNSIRAIQGRRAIVLFTDGVDYHSDESTFDGTLQGLDEEGVIVYPIRFDTRAETEKIARSQANETLPTIGVIRTTPPGTTGTTFPSDDPNAIPTSGRRSTGILGLPSPDEILRRTRRNDPQAPPPASDPSPRNTRGTRPTEPFPDPNDPRNDPSRARRSTTRNDDSVGMLLDSLYTTADSYLEKLASKSGGRLLRADTLALLPDAFSRIAAELRTQYAIGYYPTNKAHDGQYRRVKVAVARKSVTLRARPGYRAQAND
ncbi:MAG TPA: VWA domain-containing protein [Pyrinomonadaceae bacterium]|nr:VWA domain-containing protein [Pyrinomonadaceae bacterium]